MRHSLGPEASKALSGSDDQQAGPGERIAKALAHAGVASRREAERLIGEGRVAVNGKLLDSPAFKVTPDDIITVDGKVVGPRPPTRLWRYHKPAGLVTTHADPQGRDTVFDALPKDLGRVISVGRLDLNSEGLMLLTNDGELARVLELPATAWTRRYRVRAFGDVDDSALARLAGGVTVEGVSYGPVEVAVDRNTGSNIWLTVGLKEGKNREVRKVLSHVGLTVNRLLRTAYGPFQLGSLERGKVEEVRLSVLREQMGKLYPLGPDGHPLKAGEAAKTPARAEDGVRGPGRAQRRERKGPTHADRRRRP
ncbi:MAG: rRNA pseudouridine synthase [Oceanicaulis sp.]|nr:rRNA pseudouridine synthase [Oceanicaulis sp.]